MARKNGSTIIQEELYSPAGSVPREELDDARLLDLEAEQESPFLRGQKRVSVRRGTLPKKTAVRLIWLGAACMVLLVVGITAAALYRYGERSWRFRIESSDNIEVVGLENVSKSQIMEVMGGDIGRNIFFIPLAERKSHLEQIPWVETASVMRFVPNRLKVEVHERTPVAFARVGARIYLIDAGGVLMELPPAGKRKYSFPVLVGMNAGEPLSTRAPRMKIYNRLVEELDSDGARHSQGLSEVDVSDPDDVKVAVADPSGEVLVHLGSSNYLDRYKVYIAHVQEWRQQFDKLESVDLRYDRQIIVNPDLRGVPRQPALSPAAAKAAMNAGVKRAALVNYEKVAARPQTVPAPAKTAAPLAQATSPKAPAPPSKQAPAVAKKIMSDPATTNVASKAVAPKIAQPKKSAPKTRKAKARTKQPAKKKSGTSSAGAGKGASSKPAAKPAATSNAKKKPSPIIANDQGHP